MESSFFSRCLDQRLDCWLLRCIEVEEIQLESTAVAEAVGILVISVEVRGCA